MPLLLRYAGQHTPAALALTRLEVFLKQILVRLFILEPIIYIFHFLQQFVLHFKRE